MGNAVEKGPDIKIQYPVLLPAALAGHGQRVLGGPPRTVPVTVGMEDRLELFLQQPGGCGLGDPVGHAGHSQNPDPCPMILWYLHRPHRAGHVAARAHPVPQFVEAVPLPLLELADADRVHTRCSGIVTDLLPRLEHEALRNLKRLHLRFRSAHRLLPRQRGWPQVDLACTAPWLRPHYRAFPATRAVPPLCPAVLCPSRCPPLGVLPLAARRPASPAGRRYRDDRFSSSMPAPATSSRHLYTGHRQGHEQAAPWLRARPQARLCPKDESRSSVLMPSECLSMRQQWFAHARLLVAHLTRSRRAFSRNAHHPGS